MAQEEKIAEVVETLEEKTENAQETEADIMETNEAPVTENATEAEVEKEESNSSEKPAQEESANRITDDTTENRNSVFLRGMIRAIRQELDENNAEQNVLTVTTPQVMRDGTIVSERVDVIWGNNTRAEGLISEYKSGDHVNINAEFRTYFSNSRRHTNFYGIEIAKDIAPGVSGLAAHDPDKNEGYFVGTIRRINEINPRFALITLAVHTRVNRRNVVTYPTVGIGGYVYSAFKHRASDFAVGKKIGVACNIVMRNAPETGEKIITWNAYGLFYFDDEGAHNVEIITRRTYRGVRNTGRNRNRAPQVLESNAAEDLRNLSETSEAPEEAIPSEPAEVDAPRPADENPEVIEYTREENGEKTARVRSRDEMKEEAKNQVLQAMLEEDE